MTSGGSEAVGDGHCCREGREERGFSARDSLKVLLPRALFEEDDPAADGAATALPSPSDGEAVYGARHAAALDNPHRSDRSPHQARRAEGQCPFISEQFFASVCSRRHRAHADADSHSHSPAGVTRGGGARDSPRSTKQTLTVCNPRHRHTCWTCCCSCSCCCFYCCCCCCCCCCSCLCSYSYSYSCSYSYS